MFVFLESQYKVTEADILAFQGGKVYPAPLTCSDMVFKSTL